MRNPKRIRVISKEGQVKFVPEASLKHIEKYGYRVEEVKKEEWEVSGENPCQLENGLSELRDSIDENLPELAENLAEVYLDELKAQYKELTGKSPGNMKKETLEAKIAELEQKQ